MLFAVNSYQDYLSYVERNVEDLAAKQYDIVAAMNAIISLNHLEDWFYPEFKETLLNRLGIAAKGHRKNNQSCGFCQYLDGNSPELILIRELANGIKHCKPVINGELIEGYGVGPYGIGPFGAPYLLIDKGDKLPPAQRYTDSLSLCRSSLKFWDTLLNIVI